MGPEARSAVAVSSWGKWKTATQVGGQGGGEAWGRVLGSVAVSSWAERGGRPLSQVRVQPPHTRVLRGCLALGRVGGGVGIGIWGEWKTATQIGVQVEADTHSCVVGLWNG